MNEQQKKKTKNIFSIVGWVVVFLLFILSIICVIVRFSGSRYTIFGSRYDVVLTNSMSEKNEKYKEFLEGHDDQINAFDLVKSKEVKSGDDIKVFDVVIYNDRYIGTNMHRIVDKVKDAKEDITFTNSSIVELDGNKGFLLEDVDSNVISNDISFDELEMVTYSKTENASDNFYFNVFTQNYIPTVTSEKLGSGYKFTYKIHRDTTAPGQIAISHKSFYNYSNEVVLSLKVNSAAGGIECSPDNFSEINGTDLTAEFNPHYKFEIRGDKSETSDGWYTLSDIEGVVVNNYRGMGYLFRFLGSIWGGLMFVLLAILIIVVDIISGRMDKKAAAANKAETTNEELKPVNDKVSNSKMPEVKTVEEKPVNQPKKEEIKNEAKPAEEPKKEQQPVEQPKVEEQSIKKETPQRVNGRFVSKNPKPASESVKSSRWTKDNNPSINKKRGGK